jgi:DNA-binding XRE family transcriptional regulator
MDARTRERIEGAGFSIGSAAELLGLTAEESKLIELKLRLKDGVRVWRDRSGMSQAVLARKLGSTRTCIASMERGDPGVSLDELVHALLCAGAQPTDIGAILAGVDPSTLLPVSAHDDPEMEQAA